MPAPTSKLLLSLKLLPGGGSEIQASETIEGTGQTTGAHIASKFNFNPKGHVETVEEGTPECATARVFHVAVCPEGFREDNPSFGTPELAFQDVPLDLRGWEAAITRSEPEAILTVSEAAEGRTQSERIVRVEVGL